MGVLFGLQLWQSHHYTVRVSSDYLNGVARGIEKDTTGSLRTISLFLRDLATVAGQDSDRDDLRRAMSSRSKTIPEIRQAFIADADGNILVSTRADLEGLSVARRPYFTQAAALPPDRSLYLSSPIHVEQTQATVLFATLPRFAGNGRFMGVVGVSLSIDYFNQLTSRMLPAGENAAVLILTEGGDIIARAPSPEAFIGKNVSHGDGFKSHMALGRQTSEHRHVTATDNLEKLSIFHSLRTPGLPPLVIIASQPLDHILAPWRSQAVVHTLVFAALSVAVVVLSSLLWRSHVSLAASEGKLRGMFHEIPLGLALTTQDCRIIETNPAFQEILGRNDEALRDKSVAELTPPEYATQDALLLESLRQTGRFGPCDKKLIRADGSLVEVRVKGMRIIGPHGEPLVWSIVEDIGDERAAARALAESADELSRSNKELEAFAYIASHDLREPLRMINSFLQLLERRLDGRLDQECLEFLAFARDGARRMDRMILDLLEFSRVGRGENSTTETSDMNLVTRSALALLTTATADAKIVVQNLPTVRGNMEMLQRLMQNLISNACKYRHPERPCEIHITWERQADLAHFRVTDNGIGIAEEYRERVFGLFQRLHRSEEIEGSGIGLAICRKTVESLGGAIWVESPTGTGTTFHFTLPLPAN